MTLSIEALSLICFLVLGVFFAITIVIGWAPAHVADDQSIARADRALKQMEAFNRVLETGAKAIGGVTEELEDSTQKLGLPRS